MRDAETDKNPYDQIHRSASHSQKSAIKAMREHIPAIPPTMMMIQKMFSQDSISHSNLSDKVGLHNPDSNPFPSPSWICRDYKLATGLDVSPRNRDRPDPSVEAPLLLCRHPLSQ